MPIFKLSAPKTMRLLSGHILPRNASNFTCSHLNLKNFLGAEKPPDPCLRGRGMEKEGRGRGKGFLLPKKGAEERTGEGKRGESREWKGQQRGILLQGLRGDRRPCLCYDRYLGHCQGHQGKK